MKKVTDKGSGHVNLLRDLNVEHNLYFYVKFYFLINSRNQLLILPESRNHS